MNDNQLKEVFEALEIDKDQDEAKAYGLTYVDGQLVAKLIGSSGDIYVLIDNLNNDKVIANTSFDYFALITHGWAAPLNADGDIDGAPRNHPKRRRVRLVVSVDVKDRTYPIASTMQFEDEPDDLIFDHGNATGSLAEAVASLFE